LPNDFFLNPTRHSYSRLASTPQALSSFILHTFPAAASKNTDSQKKAGRESQKDEGRSMKKANPPRHQFLATRHRAVGALLLLTSYFLLFSPSPLLGTPTSPSATQALHTPSFP
jgi:hypothetical protein